MSSHSLPLYTLAGKYLKVRVTGHEFKNKYSSGFLIFVVMNMIIMIRPMGNNMIILCIIQYAMKP